MWNFLAADNLTMWTADVEHPTQNVLADRAAFHAMVSAHDMLKPTPLLRAGFWLLVCIVVCGLAGGEARARSSFRPRRLRIGDGLCVELQLWVWRLIFVMLLGRAGKHRRWRRRFVRWRQAELPV